MTGINITVFRRGEFIHEEIYFLDSKREAIKRCKEKHPEFAGKGFKMVASNYDTEECKIHFDMCKKHGLVFFFDILAG